MIPAGNTDLVLPAIGEKWGFVGVVAVFLLFGFLVSRALRTAIRAGTHFGFFLALGLASLIAFEMLLITSGVLGAWPLSGVVSPFLQFGEHDDAGQFSGVRAAFDLEGPWGAGGKTAVATGCPAHQRVAAENCARLRRAGAPRDRRALPGAERLGLPVPRRARLPKRTA